MATFGLELMFETVRRDLLKAQDVVIVLIHWKLIVSSTNANKYFSYLNNNLSCFSRMDSGVCHLK